MPEIVATALWRRLDTAGHDACRLVRTDQGWCLAGAAVFDHEGSTCLIDYTVDCDARWHTRRAWVHGSVGFEPLDFEIERTRDGEWLLDGRRQAAAAGCIDLDLGFTPATNLLPIRRLAMEPGVEVPARAAYYLEFTRELGLIEQIYRREGSGTIGYASPAHGYAATLSVHETGFVTDYPELWSGTVSVA